MDNLNRSAEGAPFFSLGHARWVVGVLNMLIAVVGRDSLLGLVLHQTRSEITSVIRDESPGPAAARAAHFRDN